MNVFSRIYRANAWNGVESLSGPGSGSAATGPVATALRELVAELGITSVLDAACGDGWWMPDLPGYVGVDVAPEAIRRSRRRHPNRLYRVGDFATMPLPRFDLVIVRDVLQHLSLAHGAAAIDALRRTGSRWLLASTYTGGANVDIADGDCYAPDLEAAPFDLGPPARRIFDGYAYHEGGGVRDERKHLALWALTG